MRTVFQTYVLMLTNLLSLATESCCGRKTGRNKINAFSSDLVQISSFIISLVKILNSTRTKNVIRFCIILVYLLTATKELMARKKRKNEKWIEALY